MSAPRVTAYCNAAGGACGGDIRYLHMVINTPVALLACGSLARFASASNHRLMVHKT